VASSRRIEERAFVRLSRDRGGLTVSGYVIVMFAGLAGMAMMAMPGIFHHGHAAMHAHGAGHAGHAGHAAHGPGHAAGHGEGNLLWLMPSPRVVFSIMTLFGGFAYLLTDAFHLPSPLAGLLAIVPAVLVERLAITPLWNLLFRFEGAPSSSLMNVVYGEAQAVTGFHNGRGMVSVVHEGRVLQLRAELSPPQAAMPVHVGDRLFIENVDLPNQRVTVSVK